MILHAWAVQELGSAAGGGAGWPAWAAAGIFAALAAILGVLLMVLLEVRRLAKQCTTALEAARDRTGPLIDHAANAARNLDHVCRVAREGVDRLDGTASRLADDVDEAAGHVRARLGELAALVDVAQTEAESAVLDAAATLRVARRGAGLAGWLARAGARPAAPGDSESETAGQAATTREPETIREPETTHANRPPEAS